MKFNLVECFTILNWLKVDAVHNRVNHTLVKIQMVGYLIKGCQIFVTMLDCSYCNTLQLGL